MAYSKQTWSSNELITADKLNHIEDGIDGKKNTQTAVADPTASGTAVAFIDSITQNADGVITPTKKTVRSASQSESGLMSATDKAKLDGIAAGAQVNSITGVKGNAETDYRTGNVNLTPANIGAVATSGNQELNGELRVSVRAKVKMSNTPYHYGFVDFDDIEDGVPEAIELIGFGGSHDFEVREKKTNGGIEGYRFPAPTIDSGYETYNVLTSKLPVTVPQGGTNATTPDGARANIGALGAFPTDISFGGSATNFYQNLGAQISTMADYEARIFVVMADATDGPFYQWHTYSGTIVRYVNATCGGILADQTGQIIAISCNGGTWSVRSL